MHLISQKIKYRITRIYSSLYSSKSQKWKGYHEGIASVLINTSVFSFSKIGQYKMQTADCRLQTADRVQNADWVQNADCRLQTGYKMQTDIWNCVFWGFLILFHFITYRLSRNPFSDVILALPGNDLAPLLEIYFLNEVSKINSFLNMI